MEKTLQKYLKINSLFSAFSGLTMLLFSSALNAFLGINHLYVFPIIGANLLLFSIMVWYVAHRHSTNSRLVNIITILDGAWVAGSLIIILFQMFDLTKNGYLLIGIVAIWIGFIGYQQFANNTSNTKH